MTRALGSASSMLRSAALAAAFAVLYFLTTQVTGWVVGDPAVLWPASGVYLGVMLVAPRHAWPMLACGALAGSLLTYLDSGASFEISVAFAVPSSAEGLLAAVLIERIAGGRFRLGGMRELFAFLVGGAVVANGLVALSVAAVAVKSFDASFAESWLRWWSADALGMIAVVPILTAPSRGLRMAASGGLGVALVATHVSAEVYVVQGFLAVLLLGSLAYAAAARDRERMREDLGHATDKLGGSAERLDWAGRRIAHLQAELVARKGEVQKMARQKEHLAADIRDAQADRERAERELADARDRLSQAGGENRELAADLSRVSGENDMLEEELSRAGTQNGALEEALSRVTTRNEALEEGLSRAGEDRRALQQEIETLRAEQARMSDELADAVSDRRTLRDEIEAVRAEQARATDELAEAVSDRRRAEDELSRASTQNGALDEELSRVGAEKRALEEELSQARAELAQAESGRRSAEEELAQAESACRSAEEELAQARRDGARSEVEHSERAQAQVEEALRQARALLLEERARYEEELDALTAKAARTEAERRLLAEHATELIARYDERGSCLYASPAALRLLGFEPEELIGHAGAELLHPEDRHLLSRARATRAESTFQARLRRKTGEYIWVEVRLRPVLAHDGDRVVAVTTTIRAISRHRDLAAA